jgi:hypothetical protein
MFVQSEKFVEAHGGRLGDISIYGRESNAARAGSDEPHPWIGRLRPER